MPPPSLARPRAPRAFRKNGARVSVRAVRVTATADAAKYDTVIIGAGVSGLSTAFTLKKDCPAHTMLVTEARDRVGAEHHYAQRERIHLGGGPQLVPARRSHLDARVRRGDER